MMGGCASGCTIRGQHRTECEDRDTCRGCLPRPAEFGQLCPWCWHRLNADVVDTPGLVRYLWALGHSGAAGGAGDEVYVHGGDPSERGILHGALDALDGLHACLASWAHMILEEHPDGARMAGPDDKGVRQTETVVVLDTAIAREYGPYLRRSETAGLLTPPQPKRRWVDVVKVAPELDRDGEPIEYLLRVPLPAEPPSLPDATSRLVRWMLPLLRWCSEQDWAGEMRRELGDVVRTTAARFPVAERTRAIPGMACPVCERASLVYDPATTERPSAQVNCTTRGCGVVFTDEEFRRLTGMIEWEHEHGTTSERIGA